MRVVAGADSVVANYLEEIAVNSFTVISSEVEESPDATVWYFRGIPRLCGVYRERAKRVDWASLGMTPTL
jgi:hypothetical protein